jgi:RecA/RadA recombinase
MDDRIEPQSAPGGLVFRLYAHDEVKAERSYTTADDEDIEVGATEMAQLAKNLVEQGTACELRIYDGDSGELIASVPEEARS